MGTVLTAFFVHEAFLVEFSVIDEEDWVSGSRLPLS